MRSRPALCLLFLSLLVASCGGPPPAVVVDLPLAAPFARLERLDASSRLPGVLAEGRDGDWILANEHLAVVVAAPGDALGGRDVGGAVVDAAPAGGEDVLRLLRPLGGVDSLRVIVDRLDSLTVERGDGSVELAAHGRLAGALDARVITRYRLRAGDAFVEIENVVVNRGREPLLLPRVDLVEWGRARPFVPGLPDGATSGRAAWVGGSDASTAYLWKSGGDVAVATDGARTTRIDAGAVSLAPADTALFRRRWHVAHGAEAEALRSTLAPEDATPRLTVEVRDRHHMPIHAAIVEARGDDGTLLMRGETSQQGLSLLPLEPGRVVLTAWTRGRGRSGETAVDLAPGDESRARLELPEAGTLRLVAADASGRNVPAAWTIRGGTTGDGVHPLPDYRTADDGATVFTAGETSLELRDGRYTVEARTAGATAAFREDVELDAGRIVPLDARFDILPPVPRWSPGDLHAHSPHSPGCAVDPDDRRLADAARGLAWRAVTDPPPPPGAILPVLPESGAATLTGSEATLDGVRLALVQEGGAAPALPAGATSFADVRAAWRSASPGGILVVSASCRPDVADAARDPDDDALLAADAWEIWSGASRRGFDARWNRWMGHLAAGRRVVAVGGGAAWSLPSPIDGSPWIVVGTAGSAATPQALLNAVRAGRVVVTNGPKIELAIGTAGPGDTVRVAYGPVDVRIRVTAPDWVDVRRVAVVVNGRDETVFAVRDRSETVRFDESVPVEMSRSGFVLVRVEGGAVLDPRPGDDPAVPPDASRLPFAFTNPLWVEISGGSR